MSIQGYKALNGYGGDADLAKDDGGLVVLFSDHEAELHHLLSTLADFRTALGVGDKPMLGELAGIVRTRMGVIKIFEREAKENAAEVERLNAKLSVANHQCDSVANDRDALRIERNAAVRERDEAVEALRGLLLSAPTDIAVGTSLFACRCIDARAALAKIEGGQG